MHVRQEGICRVSKALSLSQRHLVPKVRIIMAQKVMHIISQGIFDTFPECVTSFDSDRRDLFLGTTRPALEVTSAALLTLDPRDNDVDCLVTFLLTCDRGNLRGPFVSTPC